MLEKNAHNNATVMTSFNIELTEKVLNKKFQRINVNIYLMKYFQID